METIGEYIKAKRLEKKWKRPKLSRESGVSVPEIWRIENNERTKTNFEIMLKLAGALEISLVDMLKATGHVPLGVDESMLQDEGTLKVCMEIGKRADLSPKDKAELTNVLLRIIRSY